MYFGPQSKRKDQQGLPSNITLKFYHNFLCKKHYENTIYFNNFFAYFSQLSNPEDEPDNNNNDNPI